jgi:CheY-like chemotaxis protein
MKRVLLVDGNADARGRLANVLRERGYEVVEAADSVVGLSHLRQQPSIALILLEVASGEDASWLVSEQRESLLAAAIPVLAFTGDATHPGGASLVEHRITSKADLVDELLKTKPELAGEFASRRFQ